MGFKPPTHEVASNDGGHYTMALRVNSNFPIRLMELQPPYLIPLPVVTSL